MLFSLVNVFCMLVGWCRIFWFLLLQFRVWVLSIVGRLMVVVVVSRLVWDWMLVKFGVGMLRFLNIDFLNQWLWVMCSDLVFGQIGMNWERKVMVFVGMFLNLKVIRLILLVSCCRCFWLLQLVWMCLFREVVQVFGVGLRKVKFMFSGVFVRVSMWFSWLLLMILIFMV